MPISIDMPKLSDTMSEGTLVRWLKNPGDPIEIGDVIAEIETDKATMEMEAFDEGTLHKVFLNAGDKVPIGSRIGVLLEEGEDPPTGDEWEAAPAAPPAAATPEAAPATAPVPVPAPAPAPVVRAAGERIKASPLARKIAAEKGIDLATIAGTGPGGRITKDDVEGTSGRPATAVAPAAPAAPAPASRPPVSPVVIPAPPARAGAAAPAIQATEGAGDQRLPLSGMRTIIAERLLESKTTIPHFYLNVEVDAGPLLALRKQINDASLAADGNKYTINDFILKATAGAAQVVPQVNASFAGDAVIQFGSIHLAIAVAVEDGLLTPVIRDAQTRSLLELSLAMKDLAGRARGKKLKPEEFQGGTITVSNLGAYGVDTFDAIINPPQAVILSIANITKKPVVNAAGEIVVGQRMWVGMSCDHRVVDGAIGATYLAEFRKLIESPTLMLV